MRLTNRINNGAAIGIDNGDSIDTIKGHEEPRFTGRHMLLLMMGFFGVIITVNFFMATMASRTWTGLVVKNSYVASQKFNAELLRAEEQHRLGWKSRVRYQSGQLTFQLKDKAGAPVTLNNAKVYIGRPAFEQRDTTVALATPTPGLHATSLSLEPGVWQLKITGTHEKGPYRLDARISVSSNDAKEAAQK